MQSSSQIDFFIYIFGFLFFYFFHFAINLLQAIRNSQLSVNHVICRILNAHLISRRREKVISRKSESFDFETKLLFDKTERNNGNNYEKSYGKIAKVFSSQIQTKNSGTNKYIFVHY